MINILKNSKKLILTSLLTVFLFSGLLISQTIDFDMSYSVFITKYKLHEKPTYIVKDHQSKDDFSINDSYTFGLTSKVYKYLYIRTEFGYMDNSDQAYFEYKYQNGSELIKTRYRGSIYSKSIFLSLLPEIRKSFKDVDLYANLGPVVSSNITSSSSLSLNPTFAYQFGFGVNLYIGSIALKLGYIHFKTGSKLIREAHNTNVSFVNNGFKIGIVHTFGKKE